MFMLPATYELCVEMYDGCNKCKRKTPKDEFRCTKYECLDKVKDKYINNKDETVKPPSWYTDVNKSDDKTKFAAVPLVSQTTTAKDIIKDAIDDIIKVVVPIPKCVRYYKENNLVEVKPVFPPTTDYDKKECGIWFNGCFPCEREEKGKPWSCKKKKCFKLEKEFCMSYFAKVDTTTDTAKPVDPTKPVTPTTPKEPVKPADPKDPPKDDSGVIILPVPAAEFKDKDSMSKEEKEAAAVNKDKCLQYFDGCNMCKRRTVKNKFKCTRRKCATYKTPKCFLEALFWSEEIKFDDTVTLDRNKDKADKEKADKEKAKKDKDSTTPVTDEKEKEPSFVEYKMAEYNPVGVDNEEPEPGCKMWFNGCTAARKDKTGKWTVKNTKKKCR